MPGRSPDRVYGCIGFDPTRAASPTKKMNAYVRVATWLDYRDPRRSRNARRRGVEETEVGIRVVAPSSQSQA